MLNRTYIFMTQQPAPWRISVTVAAIITRTFDQKLPIDRSSAASSAAIDVDNLEFLMIEEHTRDGILINQPAGHLEKNESPLQASIRETLEETAHKFIPTHYLGTYLCQAPSLKDGYDVSYLRLAFCGHSGGHDPLQVLDDGIIRAFWLSYAQIKAQQQRLRSPLVLQCVEDFLAGKRYDLSSVYSHASVML